MTGFENMIVVDMPCLAIVGKGNFMMIRSAKTNLKRGLEYHDADLDAIMQLPELESKLCVQNPSL